MKIKLLTAASGLLIVFSSSIFASEAYMPPQQMTCKTGSTGMLTCDIPAPTNKYFMISAAAGTGTPGVYTFHEGRTYGYNLPQNDVLYQYCNDKSCDSSVWMTTTIPLISADINNQNWVSTGVSYEPYLCSSSKASDCPFTNLPY